MENNLALVLSLIIFTIFIGGAILLIIDTSNINHVVSPVSSILNNYLLTGFASPSDFVIIISTALEEWISMGWFYAIGLLIFSLLVFAFSFLLVGKIRNEKLALAIFIGFALLPTFSTVLLGIIAYTVPSGTLSSISIYYCTNITNIIPDYANSKHLFNKYATLLEDKFNITETEFNHLVLLASNRNIYLACIRKIYSNTYISLYYINDTCLLYRTLIFYKQLLKNHIFSKYCLELSKTWKQYINCLHIIKLLSST